MPLLRIRNLTHWFGGLRAGAARMQSVAGIPTEIVQIVQALVIVFIAAPAIIRTVYRLRKPREEEETRKYINSERGTQIDSANNELHISKLFDWFAGDFEYASGSVLEFVRQYLDEKGRVFLDKNPAIKYIHYDWALNAQEPIK